MRTYTLIKVSVLYLYFLHALIDANFDLFPAEILAFLGPSACGKSTALKAFNRMPDNTRGVRIEGFFTMGGQQFIYDPEVDPPLLRKRFGWAARKPPFTSAIYDKVAYGARIHWMRNGKVLCL